MIHWGRGVIRLFSADLSLSTFVLFVVPRDVLRKQVEGIKEVGNKRHPKQS